MYGVIKLYHNYKQTKTNLIYQRTYTSLWYASQKSGQFNVITSGRHNFGKLRNSFRIHSEYDFLHWTVVSGSELERQGILNLHEGC